jgi:phenylacetate-CoA ligase
VASPLGLYHALPPGLRSLVASWHGYRLSALRYGPQTDLHTDEALERDGWDSARWKAWHDERLGRVLRRAAGSVPYYRQRWAERRRKGDSTSTDVIANWPVLRKEALRQSPKAFLADGSETRTMYSEHTSGTTGTPVHLWRSRDTIRAWYALCEARWRRWYGLTRHDRWANIGGQLVVPLSQRRPPFWVWNAPMHQLYMSSYHLAGDLAPFYLDALEKYQVKYILGYTSSLHSLALAAKEQKRKLRLELVLTNAEPLYAHQREPISEAFQCPVRETYGMAEAVVAASECEAGKLHLWPDAGFTEVLDWDSDRAVPTGTTGRIVATGLLDPDMPLVRYETGDSGVLDPDSGPCACGRTLPRLLRVDGRNDDMLWTKDGRRVGRLDPVFKAGLHIKEAQIVQQSLSRIVVRLVPTTGYSEADERQVKAALIDRLGDVAVSFETVDAIPRETNGKFRAVVCQLPDEVKLSLLPPGTETGR